MKPLWHMKKFLTKHNTLSLTVIFFLSAKLYVFLAYLFSMRFLPQNHGFMAASRYGNFDGVHYLAIAENGYEVFQQAFFPLFPVLISLVHKLFGISYIESGLLITNISFFLLIYFLQKLLLIQYKNQSVIWMVLLFLSLPMAFFLQAIYTESLFILLVVISMILFKKKMYFFAFLICGLASAVRLNGVFVTLIFMGILIFSEKKFNVEKILKAVVYGMLGVFGLFIYMLYLHFKFNDPLLFIHAQEAFGANRTTDNFVLLPQVFFRYFKIFLTVSPLTLTFWVSVTEFIIFNLVVVISIISLRKRKNVELALFSLVSVLAPTFTGTLSSIPRYSLAALILPLRIQSFVTNKYFLIGIILILTIIQFLFAAAFFAGHFVS